MSMKEMARRLDALPLNDGWARYVPRVPAPSSRTDPENAPPRRYENESSSRTNWTVVRYEGSDHSTTWDEDLGVGCLCDSTWAVGLKPGERQSPEFFGADCSLRHCPSGDDPLTEVDETDCTNKTAAGGRGVGKPGNICHVRSSGAAFFLLSGDRRAPPQADCSNRGTCDFNNGLCRCYKGHTGVACERRGYAQKFGGSAVG